MIRFTYRRPPWSATLAVALLLIAAATGAALGWIGLFHDQGLPTAAKPSDAPPLAAAQTVIMRGSGSAASTQLASNQVHVLDGDTDPRPRRP